MWDAFSFIRRIYNQQCIPTKFDSVLIFVVPGVQLCEVAFVVTTVVLVAMDEMEEAQLLITWLTDCKKLSALWRKSYRVILYFCNMIDRFVVLLCCVAFVFRRQQISTYCLKWQAQRTRRPTSRWGSAKRDVTHPTVTVVYITCYHLFTFMHYRWQRQRYNTSHLCTA